MFAGSWPRRNSFLFCSFYSVWGHRDPFMKFCSEEFSIGIDTNSLLRLARWLVCPVNLPAIDESRVDPL